MNSSKKKSLASIAGIVAIATFISKIFGLVREQIVAAAFGVGIVVNAYAYAYVIPGFLLILLGGINGPFHSSLVSVLAKREQKEAAPLIETITTLVSTILLLVTIILVIYADKFIDLLAPGLDPNVRDMAILQLQIMAPLAIFAGLIGIGFGSLNASDQYWLPSISPLFSSLTIVIGVGGLFWFLGDQINAPEYIQFGSLMLAGTTLAGGVWQWLAQQLTQIKLGISTLKLRFDWGREGVNDVMKVMAPATLSSGMLHINVYTDLYFASYIENAAAAMRYANFIVLTPLGIISNMILVPFLPVFSRLTSPENWEELKVRIRQGLILSALTMLPLTAIFMALSNPIVRIIYERGVFKSSDSGIVAPVLFAYGVGMFFYLGRDVLVRVFYALGDGQTPFKISIVNIFLNAILDYLLVKEFETQGLVYATIGVNVLSTIAMIWILHKRLNGFPLKQWIFIFTILVIATVISGFACWGSNEFLCFLWGEKGLLIQLINLFLSSLIAVGIFLLLIMPLKLPELEILFSKVSGKFSRR
ncbi:murein biosynthesis integral membrane protein MurJ [Geminocystis sp. NIES-3709]|uniref:murein biosynthesis integral membrane protein MurJ n=1 Tax=Geminocystis sp. NIES-3709 TaxID=1617448 RepID=UPI0005FC8507|nr:murein biosynthesis integral membrane protein MurJ [Geminocystis sp. NIES-3709]BAQ65799.1 proposed peptidoglycan lipid II flippase MurJ [Geminocystis sp. NIES-3709]